MVIVLVILVGVMAWMIGSLNDKIEALERPPHKYPMVRGWHKCDHHIDVLACLPT